MSSVAPEAPVWVDGDADRLRQVVGNLLSNALKFTPPGGRVTVHLDVVEARARLRVIDTGRGIGAAFLPHMFERFRQAETTSTRSQAGLGLGLAIVRHIVDLHGGSVRAESAGEGKGATFTVALPLRRTIPREAPAEPGLAGTATAGNLAERLDGVRLIVVDDHADSREVVTTILIHAGATVTAVASVADALATMRRTRPDIVICDVAMPGESGFDLIRQIRGWPAEDGDAFRALALTAYARPEDRERALRAGFDAYVSKPAEPRDLVEAVARLAAGLRRAGAY
jgi:CheY-like chemotaxis protein